MQRFLLDKNWRFALGHATERGADFEFTRSRCLVKAGEARGAAAPKFDDSKWQVVDLPHDWAIALPLDGGGDKELCEHGFRAIGPDHPEHSVGWYRRSFFIPKTDAGRRISVEFDGVFRDSVTWINGHRLGRHESGYTPFGYDVTDLLNYGGQNVLVLRADASSWEGWWYEGAGIYRHVWLTRTAPLHMPPRGVFVTTKLDKSAATVNVRVRIVNDGEVSAAAKLTSTILTAKSKVAARAARRIKLAPGGNLELAQSFKIQGPLLWSCDAPNLYKLRLVLGADEIVIPFGIRTLRWDARRGFFLNGKPLKIKGVCNHQHFGGLGVALPDRIHQIRVSKLKAMGANAFRCSHYAMAAELLDECDRQGMLVVAENRLAGSSPAALAEFENLITRDRNHPGIILWSLANEEHTIQWSPAGERIGRTMANLAHRLDPTRKVTAAMHDRGLAEGFANIVDVHGWNYLNVGDITALHRRRPNQPIVGTEEASTVCTRGIYADDPARGYVSAYDIRSPKWGCTAEHWWKFFNSRPWLAGAFVWTGFDYYGEPIPYKWPCIASHFGLMDLCGEPKDNYYYYQSWWTQRPVLHLFPHWNWPAKKQTIDVRCFSNCEEVELFLNGQSRGRHPMPRDSHLAWPVVYAPGEIRAVGFNAGRAVVREARRTTGRAARLAISVDRPPRVGDIALLRVHAVDAAGLAVPTASDRVELDIPGSVRLLGVASGDPSDHGSPAAHHVRLFNGVCHAVVRGGPRAGVARIIAASPKLASAAVDVHIRPAGAGAARYLE